MSERKVLNKYYPPDFDPSKIPRMKLARNRQYTVRLMAPFNMRCKTCGEYIYKGKKFNARKEDVEGDDYLGIRIYRFYIKCTRCLQEISFKTDPKNTDYEIEAGATRNFMALKLAEEQAQREEDEEKEEEATNPMKLLEKRTQQSKQELELLESLEELKDLNRRQQTIDYDQMLEQYNIEVKQQRTVKEQEELDEEYVKSIFGKKQPSGTIVEEEIVELNHRVGPPRKILKIENTKNLSHLSKIERLDAEEPDRVVPKSGKLAASSYAGTSWTSGSVRKSPRTTLNSLVTPKNMFGVKIPSCGSDIKDTVHLSLTHASVISNPVENCKDKKEMEKMTEIGNTVEKASIAAISEENNTITSGLSLLGAYSGSSDNESN